MGMAGALWLLTHSSVQIYSFLVYRRAEEELGNLSLSSFFGHHSWCQTAMHSPAFRANSQVATQPEEKSHEHHSIALSVIFCQFKYFLRNSFFKQKLTQTSIRSGPGEAQHSLFTQNKWVGTVIGQLHKSKTIGSELTETTSRFT